MYLVSHVRYDVSHHYNTALRSAIQTFLRFDKEVSRAALSRRSRDSGEKFTIKFTMTNFRVICFQTSQLILCRGPL